MWMITVCIVVSVVTSAVVTKILATHYFEIVDGYVNEMCKKTKEFVNAFLYKQSKVLALELLILIDPFRNEETTVGTRQKFPAPVNIQEFYATCRMQSQKLANWYS